MTSRDSGEQRCRGLILKKTTFGEGHAILTFLDENRGKIDISAFGSSREKSKRRSALLVSNLITAVIKPARDDNPFSLKEASLERSYDTIVGDYRRISYLYLLFECLDILVQKGEQFPLFDEVLCVLDYMDKDKEADKYVYCFIIRLLKGEGILLDLTQNQALFSNPEYSKDLNMGDGTLRFIKDCVNLNSYDFLEGRSISVSVKNNLIELIAAVIRNETGKTLSSLSLILN